MEHVQLELEASHMNVVEKLNSQVVHFKTL
jgi:hypothetical protein